MKPWRSLTGRQRSEMSGTNPAAIRPQSSCPLAVIAATTPKKLTTTTATIPLRIRSKIFTPRLPES